jgi:hypothetical protein
VAVAYDRAYSGQARHLGRGALRIAARHHNLSSRILPFHAAQVGTRRPLGLCGHGARVQHHYSCLARGNFTTAGARKLCRQRIAVCLAGPAAEVFYVISFHVPESRADTGQRCEASRISDLGFFLRKEPDGMVASHLP